MGERVSVTTKHLRGSQLKIQKIVEKIKGKTYKDALLFLEKIPQKTSYRIWQTLKSVGSNAVNNHFLSKDTLIVSEVFVNQGTISKRIRARARGKAYKIEKKSSHLTISLKQNNI